ncbi:hypothetical protein C8R43DRAFT_879442, partial [Mycena crocata]
MVLGGCDPAPEGARFVGAEPKGNAALLHMQSAEAAKWLQDNMSSFLSSMGGTTVFKERLHNVVVEYVSVTFDPSRDGALHNVESDNNIQRGGLAKAKWIKPPARRYEGQKVAH